MSHETQDGWRAATLEEFEEYIANFPRPLIRHQINWTEPVTLHYFDGEDSVGRIWLYESYPKDREGQVYGWGPNKREIRIGGAML